MRTYAIQILKECYQEYVNACPETPVDFAEWIELDSESDPGFFRFLFNNDNLGDFECPDRAAFEEFLEKMKKVSFEDE